MVVGDHQPPLAADLFRSRDDDQCRWVIARPTRSSDAPNPACNNIRTGVVLRRHRRTRHPPEDADLPQVQHRVRQRTLEEPLFADLADRFTGSQ